MPEIGATLREARMRARIDIAEIETATKIRAKYLRALENEEWDLLPGPTFVKTFLRTYAEALGLDAKLLVDEYKLRHERLSDSELRPISPRSTTTPGRSGRGGGRRPSGSLRAAGGGGGGRSPRVPITIVLVVLIVGVLAAIGLTQGDDRDPVAETRGTTATTPPRTTSVPASSGTATPARRRPRSTRATLRLQPTGDVEVCLRAKGRPTPLLDGVTLRAGEEPNAFRSSRFTIRLGNNSIRIRVNGKAFRPVASDGPIGYAITRTGKRRLAAADLPSCE